MGRLVFDLDVLRTLVMGMELGSFASAADRIGRSTSAISAQLKKLEEQLGIPVLQKSGRHVVLTPAGEVMLAYARRLLELNDEAAQAVRGVGVEGEVRIGMQEDFGETLLPGLLASFSRAYPQVKIQASIGRNHQLVESIRQGRLDLALAWDAGQNLPHSTLLGKAPLYWIGKEPQVFCQTGAVPLVAFDAPCLMRAAAIEALEPYATPWQMVFTSTSLSGIWAAISAGLGVTVRSSLGMPGHLHKLDGWPTLPDLGLLLHRAEARPTAAVVQLADIITRCLEESAHADFRFHQRIDTLGHPA